MLGGWELLRGAMPRWLIWVLSFLPAERFHLSRCIFLALSEAQKQNKNKAQRGKKNNNSLLLEDLCLEGKQDLSVPLSAFASSETYVSELCSVLAHFPHTGHVWSSLLCPPPRLLLPLNHVLLLKTPSLVAKQNASLVGRFSRARKARVALFTSTWWN